MEKSKKVLADFLRKQTFDALAMISAKRGDFSTNKAVEYYQANYVDRYDEIIKTAQKDGKAADFFNQLDRGETSIFAATASKVSLAHGCTMFAEDIFENSRVYEQ